MARQRKRRAGIPRPVRIYPLPEAVSGGKGWKVRETREHEVPHVDLSTYGMAIPVDDDPVSAWIRLHEMAHARWTPVNAGTTAAAEGVQPLTANACEDARIHRKLRDAGFRLGRALTDTDFAKLAEHFALMEPIDASRLLMASIGTQDEAGIVALVRAMDGGRAVEEVTRDVWRQCFGKRRPAFPRTIDAARALEDWFLDPPDPEVLESMGDVLEKLPALPDTGHRAPGEAVWGTMKVETPALPLRLPVRVRSRTRRAQVEGSFPRNWHRLAIDGAVFSKTTKRLPGGAVLIDQSGSMSLEPADVLAILLGAPAAIVATYAGRDESGILRILARNGKRCLDPDVYIALGNNTVDGPALEWLGRQNGPRYWVSDGLATSPSGDAIRSAARIAMRHEIQRVDNVAMLIEAMDERTRR